jgi:RNA polymerase-binding transcription factor DksA
MLDISTETFERFRTQALRERDLLAVERRRIRASLLNEGDERKDDRTHHGWIVLRERLLMEVIERIDQNRFGLCVHCSGPVGKERLFRDLCQQLCTDCAVLRAT